MISSRRHIGHDVHDARLRVATQRSIDDNGDLVDEFTETRYLVDANNPTGFGQVLEETVLDDASEVIEMRTYTLGLAIHAQHTSDGETGETLHLLGDVKRSTRMVTDADAVVLEQYHYDAYGNPIAFTPADAATSVLYAGEHHDTATDQYYLRERFYDPATGRFDRMDPFPGFAQTPQSLHKYLYAHGDPVNGADPLGLFTIPGLLSGVSLQSVLIGTYLSQVAYHGGTLAREAAVAQTTINNIVNTTRTHPDATVVTHGVAGKPAPFSRNHGWSEDLIVDPLRNNHGLRTMDFIEFTWSGFDITGFGFIPNRTAHNVALISYRMALTATWSKGYRDINVISHSWGTVLSFDILSGNSVPINHWVTFGSPLKSTAPKPGNVGGDWIDFSSHLDPVTWFEMHPPFSQAPNLNQITPLQSALLHNPSVDISYNMSALMTQQVSFGEHTAYWGSNHMLNWIATHLA